MALKPNEVKFRKKMKIVSMNLVPFYFPLFIYFYFWFNPSMSSKSDLLKVKIRGLFE